MKLLINGQIQSEEAALPYSLSLLRGDGLFETILTIDEKAVAWDRHYERLKPQKVLQVELLIPQRLLNARSY